MADTSAQPCQVCAAALPFAVDDQSYSRFVSRQHSHAARVYRLPPDEPLVRVSGTDTWVHSRDWIGVTGTDLPYGVVFGLDFDGTKRQCAEVRIFQYRGGPTVTATGLRSIPVDRWKRRALELTPSRFFDADGNRLRDRTGSLQPYRNVVRRESKSNRRRTPDSELQRVADIYRQAVAAGDHPTAAVERALHLSGRNTAKKWVQRARQHGFLEPAPAQRVGGIKK